MIDYDAILKAFLDWRDTHCVPDQITGCQLRELWWSYRYAVGTHWVIQKHFKKLLLANGFVLHGYKRSLQYYGYRLRED